MTDEELDQWRGREAWRLRHEYPEDATEVIAARLARENWTPPEPVVDQDRELAKTIACGRHSELADVRAVEATAASVLAGIKAGREQEQERAEVLLAYVRADTAASDSLTRNLAHYTLAKYRGEA